MASPSVGIYIGTETADLVQLSGSFQRPKLVSFSRVPLPAHAAWRSKIRAEETGTPGLLVKGAEAATGSQVEQELAQSVKSLLAKIGLSSIRAYTSVSPEAVVIRYFQMPTIPPHERKLAVSFEAKKYLPFKLEELVTDFSVVVRRTDPTLMRIMFFGMKKNSTNTYLSLLQSSNISPLCLEPAPISLIRLLRQTGQLPPDQVAAILSLEKDAATISIAGDNLLYLSRNVTIASPSDEPMDEPPAELIEALINETRVSVDYYRRRFLGEPGVSKVILFGQGVDSKKVEEMAATLDLPVELGDPFKKLTGQTKEIPLTGAIAIGLALRALEKKPGEPNLLPGESRGDMEDFLKPVGLSIGAAVALLGLGFFLSMVDTSSRGQKLANLRNGEIPIHSAMRGTSLTDLQTIQAKQQAQLRFVRNVSQLAKDHTALLMEIMKLLPEEAWLRYLLLDDTLQVKNNEGMLFDRKKLLRLAGGSYAQNPSKEFEGINNFLAALRANTTFQNAFASFNLDAVRRGLFQEEEITEFQLTCSLNPEDAKSDAQNPGGGWTR